MGFRKFLHVAGLILSSAIWSHASETTNQPIAAPQHVVIPKLKGSIKIDGKLNESVWSQAATLRSFRGNEHGEPERELTEVRLWYDAKAIYLGWKCTDADIQATFTKRDSKFWEEEVVEFFVTAGELKNYFEFQWNPLNGVFDAKIANDLETNGVSKGIHGDWNYTAKKMKSAVIIQRSSPQAWEVEVKLPFADMKLPTPRPGEVWRADFFRVNRGKDSPAELLSWSPTRLPGFHQPSRFGYLEFGPDQK